MRNIGVVNLDASEVQVNVFGYTSQKEIGLVLDVGSAKEMNDYERI